MAFGLGKKKYKKGARPLDPVRCFNAAYDAAQVHKVENPVIVHGVINNAGNYVIYSWCEVEDSVYDYTLNKNPLPKDIYYETNNVVETGMKRYSFQEYTQLLLKNSGFGPFDHAFFKTILDDLVQKRA